MRLIRRLLGMQERESVKNPTPEEVAAGVERAKQRLAESDALLVETVVRDVHRALVNDDAPFDEKGRLNIKLNVRIPDRLLIAVQDGISESGVEIKSVEFSVYNDLLYVALKTDSE